MTPARARTKTPLLFRALLLLYPPDFRREFGPAILQLLRDQWRDVEQGTAWTHVRFYSSAVADIALSALREQASAHRARTRARSFAARYHVWAAALIIGLSAVNLAYDLLSPELSMGIGAWLLTALAPCLGVLLLLRARRIAQHR